MIDFARLPSARTHEMIDAMFVPEISMSTLFDPLQPGDLVLPDRIIMAISAIRA